MATLSGKRLDLFKQKLISSGDYYVRRFLGYENPFWGDEMRLKYSRDPAIKAMFQKDFESIWSDEKALNDCIDIVIKVKPQKDIDRWCNCVGLEFFELKEFDNVRFQYYEISNTVNEYASTVRYRTYSLDEAYELIKGCEDWYSHPGSGTINRITFYDDANGNICLVTECVERRR